MNDIIFWNRWGRPYKQLIWGLLLLCVLSLSVQLAYSLITNKPLDYTWAITTDFEYVKDRIDSFQVGDLVLDMPVDQVIAKQKFQGQSIKYPAWLRIVYLLTVALAIVIGLSTMTYFKRNAFYLCISCFIGFLLLLRLEQLLCFGRPDHTQLLICLVLFGGLSYYFHSFRSHTSFTIRILCFAAAMAMVGFQIHFTAQVQDPWLQLAHFGALAPLAVVGILIFLVSHEIIYGGLIICTYSFGSISKNNLHHFLAISAIYLVSLLLVFLHKYNGLSWSLIALNPIFLLALAIIIGLFGQHHRYALLSGWIPSPMLATLWFITLSLLAGVSIVFFYFNGQQGYILAIEEVVIYSFLGSGVAFLIYVITNFLPLLIDNLQVYKVAFDPKRLPFYVVRLAGYGIVLILIYRSGLGPYHQTMAQYFNSIADVYTLNGQEIEAIAYYEKATQLKYNDHHGHYALAKMAQKNGDAKSANFHYTKANRYDPSPQAYVDQASLFHQQGQFFDAVFTLKDGLLAFPGNLYLQNNLGLQYARTNIIDTAYIYFNRAASEKITRDVAHTNILYLLSNKKLDVGQDLVHQFKPNYKNQAAALNYYSLGMKDENPFLSGAYQDSIQSFTALNLMYNHSLWAIKHQNNAAILALDQIYEQSEYLQQIDQLAFTQALLAIHLGKLTQAFKNMNHLVAYGNHDQKGYYAFIGGLFALKLGEPLLAIEYFEMAKSNNYSFDPTISVMALFEAGRFSDAQTMAQALLQTSQVDSTMLLQFAALDQPQQDPAWQYRQFRYQQQEWDITSFTKELAKFSESPYYFQLVLDRLLFEADHNNWDAVSVLLELVQFGKTSPFYPIWQSIHWKRLVQNENWEQLEPDLADATFALDSSQYFYFQGLLHWKKYSDEEQARKLLQKCTQNPFLEDGIIAWAHFLNANQQEMDAYEALLQALELNKFSPQLLKAYINQCVRVGLSSYADISLDQLSQLVSPSDFEEFKAEYDGMMAEKETWDD